MTDLPRIVAHDFPLRPDVMVRLVLPVDLTADDAERVVGFVRSLTLRAVPVSDTPPQARSHIQVVCAAHDGPHEALGTCEGASPADVTVARRVRPDYASAVRDAYSAASVDVDGAVEHARRTPHPPPPRDLAAELVDRGDGWHVSPEYLTGDSIGEPRTEDDHQ
jgi:hypothetical protein